jgi:hypothetical protein
LINALIFRNIDLLANDLALDIFKGITKNIIEILIKNASEASKKTHQKQRETNKRSKTQGYRHLLTQRRLTLP